MSQHWTTHWRAEVEAMIALFDANAVDFDYAADFLEFMLFVLEYLSQDAHDFNIMGGIEGPGVWPRFDFDRLSDHECRMWFRFRKQDVAPLAEALGLPEIVHTGPDTRYTAGRVEAMCILLWRLSYANKWDHAIPVFGRCVSSMSQIVHWLLNFIINVQRFGRLLEFPAYYSEPARLRHFADRIYAKSGMLSNCVGFIDGTLRKTCRPKYFQRIFYNGHKRHHGLKWQAIVSADGIISDLRGPFEGRHTDAYMVGSTGIADILDVRLRFPLTDPASIALHTPAAPDAPAAVAVWHGVPNIQYCLYGDKGYTNEVSGCVIAAFRGDHLTPPEIAFNRHMARSRITCEWGLMGVVTDFGYMNHKEQMKIWNVPAGLYYQTAALLENMYSCLYGSRIATYFETVPPTLAQYIAMLPPL